MIDYLGFQEVSPCGSREEPIFRGSEELFTVFNTSRFPARKSLSGYTFWRTSSKGTNLTPASRRC